MVRIERDIECTLGYNSFLSAISLGYMTLCEQIITQFRWNHSEIA